MEVGFMNSKILKHWIADAMLALAVSCVAIAVPTDAYAKTRMVQVQDSYTIDELFQIVKSKYPDAERIGERGIKIKILTDSKLLLNLSKSGEVLSLVSYWGKDQSFSLRKLNEINDKYKFGKVYLDEDDELRIQMDIDLSGVSKDYILSRINSSPTYHMFVLPELAK